MAGEMYWREEGVKQIEIFVRIWANMLAIHRCPWICGLWWTDLRGAEPDLLSVKGEYDEGMGMGKSEAETVLDERRRHCMNEHGRWKIELEWNRS
jgi:hypothetical protein